MLTRLITVNTEIISLISVKKAFTMMVTATFAIRNKFTMPEAAGISSSSLKQIDE